MNCQEEKQKKYREGLKETEIWYSRQFQGCSEESEHGTEKPKYIRKEVQKQNTEGILEVDPEIIKDNMEFLHRFLWVIKGS